jgi:hypothetical protein
VGHRIVQSHTDGYHLPLEIEGAPLHLIRMEGKCLGMWKEVRSSHRLCCV